MADADIVFGADSSEVVKAVNDLSKLNVVAAKVDKTTQNLARDTRGLSVAMRDNAHHVQNAGYQVGDFFVQVASGQNAMMALSQQLPQLLGGFGAIGAAAGAVTAILGASWMIFADTATAAEQLDSTLASLDARLKGLSGSVEASLLHMDQLIVKYGSAAAAAREWLLIDIQKEVLQTNNALREQASAVSGLAGDYARALNPTVEMLRVELNAIEDDFGLVGDEAVRFRDMLLRLKSAEGLEEQVKHLEDMRVFFKENNIELSKLPDGFADAFVSLSPLVTKAWELANAMSVAGAAVKEMSTGTPIYSQGFSGSGLLPPTPKPEEAGRGRSRGGSRGSAAVKQAEKQFQSIRELLEKETVFQFAEYEKRHAQLTNALNREQLTKEQYAKIEQQLRTLYFGTEYAQRQVEYDMSLEQLRRALELEYLTRQEYENKKTQLQWQYTNAALDLNSTQLGAQLNGLAGYFSQASSLAGGSYSGLLKAQQAFAASSALISAYSGASQALADPTLTTWQKIAAAGKVLTTGLGFVSAIKSGGNAGGSGGVSASVATQQQEPMRQTTVRIEGDTIFSGMMESIVQSLWDRSKDGELIIYQGGR